MSGEEKDQESKPLTLKGNSKLKVQPKYDVHRDVLTHELVINRTGYVARDKSIPNALKQCCKRITCLGLFTGILPIIQWLPKYRVKKDLLGDVIAGFTVAIMHIPHGMAYGLLAGVSAGSGLYMAIFPALVYMLLGTSKHISIGTFAVASMMTLKVVQSHSNEDDPNVTAANLITAIQVATALALTVGFVHLIMALFRLGTLASLLSDPLVNGFTCGAACHVIASQLKDVLGVTVPRQKGALKIIYTLIDLARAVPSTNLVAFLFCLTIIIFMTICNEGLKPLLKKVCSFPLPAELIAVIGGTLVSRFMFLNSRYNVQLVGVIPKGLPMPEVPRIELVPKLIVDSIAIAFVTYSIVMSMGLTFAKKHKYEVRPNQELFALGISNVVGGFFSCIPIACSLSRSVIQDQTGGATQLASLVSAILIVITVVWAGPFFSDLPRCVLAGVIIVALKPMFMQARKLKQFAKEGKLELITWIATFFAVVIIDIDIGLLVGVAFSLLTLFVKGVKPYGALLGYVPEAPAIYVDINQHPNAVEIPETKLYRYYGSINFATSRFYRKGLYDVLGFNKQEKKPKKPKKQKNVENQVDKQANGQLFKTEEVPLNVFHYLILDFSMLGHVDVAGCMTLTDIKKDLTSRDIALYVAAPTDRVYDSLVHSMALGAGPFEVFPTLHDAVEYANAVRTS